jgi:hypothetical protein
MFGHEPLNPLDFSLENSEFEVGYFAGQVAQAVPNPFGYTL